MILKPVRNFPSYSVPLAQELYELMKESIFDPLEVILREEKENAKDTVLEEALKSGKIQYTEGAFIGPLNVAISKELRGIGARYNKIKKAYTLDLSRLPPNVLAAIAFGNQKLKGVLKKVQDFLYAIEGREIKIPDLEPFFGNFLGKLGVQFQESTEKVTGEVLEIPMAPHLMKQVREEYEKDLGYYLEKFHKDQVYALKKKVEKNVSQGFRAEKLVADIQLQKKMSKRHARFIAKQETSLLTSTYTRIRYADIGVNEYIWSTSMDERVRPTPGTRGIARANNHRILQGRKFRFDHPPIVDTATGRTANPGEDFGCRCVAIPYVSRGVNMIEPKPALERLTAY